MSTDRSNFVPICFLDVETDGIHPDRVAWEVAAIRREPDGAEVEHHWFVEIELATSDPMGLRVGGFYERHPVGRYLSGLDNEHPTDAAVMAMGPRSNRPLLGPYEAAKRLARATHGALIVGAVPSFDTECLAAMLRDQGLAPAWRHRLRCVETLAAGHLRREVGGLADCAAALGIEHPDAHTALGDARTARAIWDAVMAGDR